MNFVYNIFCSTSVSGSVSGLNLYVVYGFGLTMANWWSWDRPFNHVFLLGDDTLLPLNRADNSLYAVLLHKPKVPDGARTWRLTITKEQLNVIKGSESHFKIL